MDMDKFAMLKAIAPQKDFVSVAQIKAEFNVTGEEAEEMISKLAQAGVVEPYPCDGLHFKVIRRF